MPFIDRSTLTYPATNAFPVRKWLDKTRAPTSADYKNFELFDLWIWEGQSAWILIDKTATDGTWLQFGASGTGILTITGDSGGAVGADGANNINILTGSNLTFTGDAGTNTLTMTLDGTVSTSFPTDAGTATPSGGIVNVLGAGGTNTSAVGNTITVTSGPTVPTTFTADAGSATPALNNLNVLGTNGITTTGAGDTLTVTGASTLPLTFAADSGTAQAAANIITIAGSGSTTTSASGSTVTITSSGGGLSWNEITVVGPTAMTQDMGYVANSASRVQLDLPVTAAFGSIIEVVGKGTGGWQINQIAGQSILEVGASTTVGASGLLTSSEAGATIRMVCITANTTWRIIGSTGNHVFT